MCAVAAIQPPDQARMMPCRQHIYHNAAGDQRGTEPEGKAGLLLYGTVLDSLEFLQKKSESRHNKTEPHQGETGTNPCEKRPLSSQIVAQVGLWLGFHRLMVLLSATEIFTRERRIGSAFRAVQCWHRAAQEKMSRFYEGLQSRERLIPLLRDEIEILPDFHDGLSAEFKPVLAASPYAMDHPCTL